VSAFTTYIGFITILVGFQPSKSSTPQLIFHNSNTDQTQKTKHFTNSMALTVEHGTECLEHVTDKVHGTTIQWSK